MKLSDEHKAKLQAGREKARQLRQRRGTEEELAAVPAEIPDVPPGHPQVDAELPQQPSQDEQTAVPAIDRDRLLAGIPADIAALISDAELAEIAADERAKARADRKAAALRDLRAAMRQEARAENDLIPRSVLMSEADRKRAEEPVTFRVTVPLEGSGDPSRGAAGFRVDGQLFQHGRTYTRSRVVFESLRWMHFQTHLHEVRFRTLDQHKPGNSAIEVLGRTIPQFEVIR